MKSIPVFVILYLVLMIPTYLLPYLNFFSILMLDSAGPWWLHLLCLVLLSIITWFRGKAIEKTWLLIFPILAMVFDLLPFMNFIPLVPTVMHILAIVLGVSGQKSENT